MERACSVELEEHPALSRFNQGMPCSVVFP